MSISFQSVNNYTDLETIHACPTEQLVMKLTEYVQFTVKFTLLLTLTEIFFSVLIHKISMRRMVRQVFVLSL